MYVTCLEQQSFCHALRKNLKFKLLYFQNKECYPAENKQADGNLYFLLCDEDKNPKLCLVMNFSFLTRHVKTKIGTPVFIVLFPMMLLVFTFPDKYMKMADRAHKRLAVISEHLNVGKLPSKTPDICPNSASDLDNDSLVVSNDLLTQEQVDFYNKNGYLVVRNLVPQYLLSRYLERFQQICDGTVRVPGLTVMKDVVYAKSKHPSGERTINKIQNFEEDEVLFSYCELPQIVKYVACFTGADIKSVHTMLINKPPDPGTMTSRHPLHQDLHYFPFRPASRMVCSWTAMEKVDTQNGCLVVLPGTHYSPLLQHYYPKWEGGVNVMYHGIKDYDPSFPMVHLEMNAGDTVFFHPLLIHGSGANKTQRFRKAISGHYASSHCYFIDVRGTTQENIEAEVLEVARKKLGKGVDISFQDLWRMKSRLVHGSEGTL